MPFASHSHISDLYRPLRVPVIAAPMFLISGPELVIAASRAGTIGTFPTPNCRTTEELRGWLKTIKEALASAAGEAPLCWGVNLIVHRTNARLQADLEAVVQAQVPLVVASVGRVDASVIEPVHAYGGKVYTDVVSLKHATQAIKAGVDGLILLTRGAGGHEGHYNPFAFVREVRRIFKGPIALAGCIADGNSIVAAQALGADFAYMGTAFIAATESLAQQEYREMLVSSTMDDVVASDKMSGMSASLLKPSLVRAGIDFDTWTRPASVEVKEDDLELQKKRWKEIWASGQAVGGVQAIAPIAQIVDRLEREYRQAEAEMFNSLAAA